MVTIVETAVSCSECAQQYFESKEGENGRCMDCCSCWNCEKPAGLYTLAIDGQFCSLRCEEDFVVACLSPEVTRKRKSISPAKRLAVFERDGWACHLCSLAISPLEKWPAPESAVVDHVIAWSKGGVDDIANLRAAHAICNLRRRDQDLDLFLAMS